MLQINLEKVLGIYYQDKNYIFKKDLQIANPFLFTEATLPRQDQLNC